LNFGSREPKPPRVGSRSSLSRFLDATAFRRAAQAPAQGLPRGARYPSKLFLTSSRPGVVDDTVVSPGAACRDAPRRCLLAISLGSSPPPNLPVRAAAFAWAEDEPVHLHLRGMLRRFPCLVPLSRTRTGAAPFWARWPAMDCSIVRFPRLEGELWLQGLAPLSSRGRRRTVSDAPTPLASLGFQYFPRFAFIGAPPGRR
jgi:hypothetical protein